MCTEANTAGSPGVITRDSFLASVEAVIAHSLFTGGSSDVSSLRVQMIDVCSTKDLYKRVLSLEGSRAQKWLDALQMVSAKLSGSLRCSSVKAAVDA